MNIQQYRRLRTIYLRAARAYRLGSVWGPADAVKMRAEQRNMLAIRSALHG